jgi:hypothetical protein
MGHGRWGKALMPLGKAGAGAVEHEFGFSRG